MSRRLFLWLYCRFYGMVRGVLFWRYEAQTAHEKTMRVLAWCDRSASLQVVCKTVHQIAFITKAVCVGGVELANPLILAAGFVKGAGFECEDHALAAVQAGENILYGWCTMPNLVGAVEFGSFTRYPRLGNQGVVMWRDPQTQSTQNRVGLKNPGARAAAAFVARNILPPVFGINLAPSPSIADPDQEVGELVEALRFFTLGNVLPAWFTLNLSCPNTEDDPHGRQSETKARHLCGVLVDELLPFRVPLWVKVSPDLSDQQYAKLMAVFAEVGVKAVIATNTLAQAIDGTSAGVGGGRLHSHALRVTRILVEEKKQHGYPVDVIGCGGVRDRKTYLDFMQAGAAAVQYWSGLVYSGPLVAALALTE